MRNFLPIILSLCYQFQKLLDSPDSYSYQVRVINAGLHLQALVLKHQRLTRREIKKLRKFKEVLKSTPLSSLSLEEELKERKGVEERLQEFMGQNFFKILRDNSLVPDRHTYEVIISNSRYINNSFALSLHFCIEQALLLSSCFSDVAMVMADQVLMASLGTSGVEYLPSSFASWTQHCGPLLPHQAIRVSIPEYLNFLQEN